MAKKVQSKSIKLTEEEIKLINNFNTNREAIKTELYTIAVTKINLEQREEAVKNRYIQNGTLERQIAQALQEKYGEGSVDIQSGTFQLA